MMTATAHSPATRGGYAAPANSVRPGALGVGVLALALLGALTAAALWTAGGQQMDESAMRTVSAGRDTQLTLLSVLGRVSIGAVVTVTVISVAVALLRGRMRLAIGAVVVLGGSNLSTQVLKHAVLERSEFVGGLVAHNSLPSGHTTVVAAGVGALCLVVPGFLRTATAALGAGAVTLTGASTVVAGWHRPADVAAAVLVALLWTAVATVVVGGHSRAGRGGFAGSVIGAGVAVVGLIALGVRPTEGMENFVQAGLVLGGIGSVTALAIWAMDRVVPAH